VTSDVGEVVYPLPCMQYYDRMLSYIDYQPPEEGGVKSLSGGVREYPMQVYIHTYIFMCVFLYLCMCMSGCCGSILTINLRKRGVYVCV